MPYEMEMEEFREDLQLNKSRKKCLVIGGAGFIGSNLVDELIRQGHYVRVVDNMSTGKKENLNPMAEFYPMDIRADISTGTGVHKIQNGWPSDSWNAFENIDIVFHTAAKARVQPSIEDPISFNDVNVRGTLRMLKAAVDNNVKRFVFSSSSSVYGNVKKVPTVEESELNPLSPYALQKLIGEQYCKLYSELHGLETVCLRYFNVYGERQLLEGAYCLVMGKFAQQRLEGKPMTIRGDGEQRRDFTYVGDVVNANIQAGFYPDPLKGVVFNVGNGDNRSVNQIADLIGGDRVNVDPVIEPKETLADTSAFQEFFDWKPTMKVEDWIPKWKESIGL